MARFFGYFRDQVFDANPSRRPSRPQDFSASSVVEFGLKGARLYRRQESPSLRYAAAFVPTKGRGNNGGLAPDVRLKASNRHFPQSRYSLGQSMSTPESVENIANPLVPIAKIVENSWPNSYGQPGTIKDVSK